MQFLRCAYLHEVAGDHCRTPRASRLTVHVDGATSFLVHVLNKLYAAFQFLLAGCPNKIQRLQMQLFNASSFPFLKYVMGVY